MNPGEEKKATSSPYDLLRNRTGTTGGSLPSGQYGYGSPAPPRLPNTGPAPSAPAQPYPAPPTANSSPYQYASPSAAAAAAVNSTVPSQYGAPTQYGVPVATSIPQQNSSSSAAPGTSSSPYQYATQTPKATSPYQYAGPSGSNPASSYQPPVAAATNTYSYQPPAASSYQVPGSSSYQPPQQASASRSDYYASILGKKSAPSGGVSGPAPPSTTSQQSAGSSQPISQPPSQPQPPVSSSQQQPPSLTRKKTEVLRSSTSGSSGGSSAAVELLQMQIQRLETELKRKGEEFEVEKKRLQEELTKKPKQEVSTANLLEKVELEKLKVCLREYCFMFFLMVSFFFQVDLKTLRENEDRQKARIEALTKQVADERQAKEESERQLAVKLKALTFAEKKLERVDQVMTEAKSTASKREIALQQSIDAKSLQLEQLNALCASQQNRLEVLSQEMEGRGAEFASKVAAAEARNAEVTAAQNLLKGEIKKLTQELDAARIADLEARQRNDEQLQQKEAELREAKNKFDRDIAKLEQAVAAIQSGRGRLEQLQELQSDHAKKEQEFQEKIAELTEQVESLSAENEALAESNAAMVAAMEGAGAEVKEALGSRMDTKSWEERVKKLEGENAGLQEQGVMLEKTKEQLEGQIEGSQEGFGAEIKHCQRVGLQAKSGPR
jgi:hypothetical protein